MDKHSEFVTAESLIKRHCGDAYFFGSEAIPTAFHSLGSQQRQAFFIHSTFAGSAPYLDQVRALMDLQGIHCCAELTGIQANAPREDLSRLLTALQDNQPDLLISFGGGSVIDAVKAANALYSLGGEIEDYFGTGLVTRRSQQLDKPLLPHLAIQAAASSAAHLTRYANITDRQTSQKKLIVDDALVPPIAAFDYRSSLNAPAELTIDGALDGISHALEVFYSLAQSPQYPVILPIAETAIALLVNHIHPCLADPQDLHHRTALGLGTDLGGVAIMTGGTNGGHLTSFSLVDLLPHGRACALLNPYYTVFFAAAIQGPLQVIGRIFHATGYLPHDPQDLRGRALGMAVAQAMITFMQSLNLPTTLSEVKNFHTVYIERALSAAKNPQLAMKLRNMPVPIAPEALDDVMGPILQAAASGDLSLIPEGKLA